MTIAGSRFCSEIIEAQVRDKYNYCFVLHCSDLPRGRGWSPYIWEIIDGATKLTLSLLEAGEEVDTGRIWKKVQLDIPDNALWDEINEIIFSAEIQLIDAVLFEINTLKPIEQNKNIKPTYFPKRIPSDSRIDPDQTLTAQFDKIRVCDPERYPAFFDLRGHRYKLSLEKIKAE